MNVAVALGTVEVVMLAGVRFAAFLVIAPPFSHRGVPARVKVILALGLALATSPRAAQAAGRDGSVLAGSTGAFVGDLVLQVVVGAALGFLVLLAFSAVQAAGNLLDLFGGFYLAMAFDPMSMTNGAHFSRLYQWTAVVLMVASDAHHLVLGGLARTFDALPLGTGLNLAALGQVATTGLVDMFVAALQIAGPLIVVLFLADVGLGLLTRVAPALNAFALGFPLKILLAISLGAVLYLTLPGIVGTLTGTAVENVLEVGR